jgi:GNAT superfamily N-acetyltransferase
MEELFQVIIRHSVDLNENENREIEEVDRLAFAGEEDDIEWSSSEWYVLGKKTGRIVSLVGILKRGIRVGEIALEVGGVGGFATHPDHQRHGFGSAVLKRAAEFMRDDLQVEFGLLVCGQDMIAYYGKHGWQIAEAEMVFTSQGIKHVFHDIIMVLPLGERAWPKGMIDLCGKPW